MTTWWELANASMSSNSSRLISAMPQSRSAADGRNGAWPGPGVNRSRERKIRDLLEPNAEDILVIIAKNPFVSLGWPRQCGFGDGRRSNWFVRRHRGFLHGSVVAVLEFDRP